MSRFLKPLFSLALWTLPLLPALAQEESQFFDSDGVKIHFVEKGEGEPVVLVHGFAASAQLNWGMPGLIDKLSNDYHVVALDNRGHGKSDKPHGSEQYGINMVQDVIRLMDHLEFDKAHIVGYSMGGFITTKLVCSHPERVASAVIGAAGWHEDAEERLQLLDEIGESLESGNGISPLIIALTPEGQPKPSKQMLKTTNQMLMLMNDPLALASAIRGMRHLNVTRQELAANRVPALSVIGSLDPLKDGVDELGTVMGQLQVDVIDGADHMTAINNPQLLTLIQRHLQAHALQPVAVAAGK